MFGKPSLIDNVKIVRLDDIIQFWTWDLAMHESFNGLYHFIYWQKKILEAIELRIYKPLDLQIKKQLPYPNCLDLNIVFINSNKLTTNGHFL